MIAESLVKGWATSTESKIKEFIDQYLINYPQQKIRQITQRLLASLFRKGTEEQRQNVIRLMTERVGQLSKMGKASREFLALVTHIMETLPKDGSSQVQSNLMDLVIAKTKDIFERVTSHREYPFYSSCANMVDFGDEFRPELLEANGCMQCFDIPEVSFESTSINSLREETRAHLHGVEWVLRRRYEIKNLQVSFVKKKINYKTVTIYYHDHQGLKVELGKYNPNENIPSYDITATSIGIHFEFGKIRRNHISCMLCSNNEEYAVLCSNCAPKLIEMECRAKIVGGSPDKINKELIDACKGLGVMREQLRKFVTNVAHQEHTNFLRGDIIQDMSSMYNNMIQNLRLLRTLSAEQLREEMKSFSEVNSDCYSWHFYELKSCLEFILNSLKQKLYEPDEKATIALLNQTKYIMTHNRMNDLKQTLAYTTAELLSRLKQVAQQLGISSFNDSSVAELLVHLTQHAKTSSPPHPELAGNIRKFLLKPANHANFTLTNRIRLFVVTILNEDQLKLLKESSLAKEQLEDIKRLSVQQFEEFTSLLGSAVTELLSQRLDNWLKIFLSLLPEELVPESNLQIEDPEFLTFIKVTPPVINKELVYENIVFSPNPIIKLNSFRLLPRMIALLPLQASIEVIKQLCQYRNLWNTHIYQAVQCFDKMLDAVQKERRLALCLEGYDCSRESFYFEHVARILTPQRPDFIIRLEIPERQMQKEEKNKGGPVEYIYLPVREVRSQDLKGDTMGALHEWITGEIRKMNQDMSFDLIVDNTIVDNLDLSLEIVYRKLVKREAKRQIGSKTYDFFSVIYRIQGIFGEANEKNAGNPRDQKLEECITFSSYLLNKLPSRNTGLDVIMGIIPTLEKSPAHRDRKNKMLKILSIMFRNETIIRKVVEWQYGNDVLGLAVKFVSIDKQDLTATESLLEMASQIVDEANKEMVKLRKGSEGLMRSEEEQGQEREDSAKAVQEVLDKVKEAEGNGLRNISKKLIKILPFCSRDDMKAARFLFDYFQIGKLRQLRYSSKLSWLQEFMQALSESYASFKTICREEGITQQAIEVVANSLEIFETHRQDLDVLEMCLIFLKGLVQGDYALQENLFELKILQQIYKVSSLSGKQFGKIPSICFEIVKYFGEGKMISPQVQEFFSEQTEQKKKRIHDQKSQRKKAILMKKQQAMKSWESLMQNEEQELLACSTCKQGYHKKNQVLGVYLYSSRIEILAHDQWWSEGKKVNGITSTSYFQPIHLECHIEAMKDDMKLQKSEWDGALIRNSEVLCNNWCPFKGPNTTPEEFDKVMRKYFESAGKGCVYWTVLNDLNGLLEKFSREYNFALQTKGSSHTHNAKLIPVLIGFTSHLMKDNQDVKSLREGMAHIEQHLTKKPQLIYLYFCGLLFTCSLSQLSSKREFCLRLIENLGYGNFKDLKPFYVYLGLVQSIMRAIHKSAPQDTPLHVHLTSFIAKNMTDLVSVFDHIAEEYKIVYLKWESANDAKQFLNN